MIKRPSYLTGKLEKDFWNRHAKQLEADGILTVHDIDSFAMLCKVWQRLQSVKDDDPKANLNFNALLKCYMSAAKAFGLLPRERTKAGMGKKDSLKDILGKINDA